MRPVHVVFSLLLLLPAMAVAQDPVDVPVPTLAEAEVDGEIGVGDTVFALADTPSTRFPEGEDEGPTFTPGSKLVVLVSESGRLRVMSPADNAFGWVPASTVTAKKPEIDMDALLESLRQGAPGGQIPGMGSGAQ